MVTVAVACGLAGALGAIVFRFLIRFMQAAFFEGAEGIAGLFEEGLLAETSDPLAVARSLAWYWRLLIPAAGGLIVGPLIYFFAREAKGHGVPEVMEAVALRGGRIRPVVALVKSLASSLSIGTGGSVGREGPIVQIGSTIGSTLGQALKMSDENKVAMPANWPKNDFLGDKVIIPPATDEKTAKERLSKYDCYDWWFCTKEL